MPEIAISISSGLLSRLPKQLRQHPESPLAAFQRAGTGGRSFPAKHTVFRDFYLLLPLFCLYEEVNEKETFLLYLFRM